MFKSLTIVECIVL